MPGERLRSRPLSRRRLLKGAGALGAAALLPLPLPAIAQSMTVRYTLSWLPTGGNAYVYVARQLGFWKRRGIEVEINRGFGSMASIQAVSQRQFDLGNAGTGAVLLAVIKGLDLTVVNTIGYDSGIGIIVPADGPVTTPAALAGRSIAATAAGSDTPFLPPYFKRLGLAPDSVSIAHVEAQMIEKLVIERRVDGMVAVASSSIPNFVAQNVPIRFFPIADQGLRMYGSSTIASSAYLRENRALATAFVEGMLEGQKFCLLNPHEAVERFLSEQKVMATTKTARPMADLAMGIAAAGTVAPEAETHSLGYTDLASLDQQAHLIRDLQAADAAPELPEATRYATNDLIGKVVLSDAEWRQVRAYAAPFAAQFGRTL
jgi:NitT/TauT family transport system substrate-binding protein